jgi:hypothetical protein
MGPIQPAVPIRDEEARYLAIQLVNRSPMLQALLLRLRNASYTWERTLLTLQQVDAEPDRLNRDAV